jgi:hypothetical protein
MSTSVSSPPSFPFSSGTGLSDAQQNQLASSTQQVAVMNTNLKSIYLTAFSNWCISVNAGRISNADPPQPPVQYVISPPDGNGFQWPMVDPAGTPVCAMPPVPADQIKQPVPVPNTFVVGHWLGQGGNWFSVGPGDTVPSGFTTPPGTASMDSPPVIGTFQKYGAPVGAGWYLKTA